MLAKYSDNPIEEFSNILCNEIRNYNNDYLQEYSDIDSICKLILLNNGCKINDSSKSKYVLILDESLVLYFITNAEGNEVNKIYDVFEVN